MGERDGDQAPGGERDCDEVLRMVHEFLDGEIDSSTHTEVNGHLELCLSCLEVVEFEMELKATIAQRCRDEAPEELVLKLRRLLAAEGGGVDVSDRS